MLLGSPLIPSFIIGRLRERDRRMIDGVLQHQQEIREREEELRASTPDEETGLSSKDYTEITEQVQPYTMVPSTGIVFTAWESVRLIANDIPGVLVECGVWRGGASMAMLLAQRRRFGCVLRPVFMLDSFEGLPAADDRDGALALAWQSGAEPESFFNNCQASLDEVRTALREMEFKEPDYHLIKGWFRATVPDLAEMLNDEPIALLRLDGDWYESTKVCLENLFPLVAEGGTIIIDDYYDWNGCARAVHEYLGNQRLSYRIRSLEGFNGAFIYKKKRVSFER